MQFVYEGVVGSLPLKQIGKKVSESPELLWTESATTSGVVNLAARAHTVVGVAAYLDWLKKFEGNFDQEAQTQLDNVDDVVQRRTCIMPAAVVKFAHAKIIAK